MNVASKLPLPVLLLGLLLGAGAGGQVHPDAAAWSARVDTGAVERDLRALETLLRLEGPLAVADALAVHLAASRAAPARHEPVLLGFARALGELPPQAEIEPLLALLAGHEAVALAAHPEGPQHGIPAFPVAAAAAGALHRWEGERVREDARRALRTGDGRWFADRAGRPWRVPEQRGLAEALSAADAREIEAVFDGLAALWHQRPELARTAAVAARVTGHGAALREALAGPGAGRLAPELAMLEETLPPAAAEALWAEALAAGKPVLRSVALQQLARRGKAELVLVRLGDPELGAAAALALARAGAVQTLASVARDRRAASAARRHAALGLGLSDAPAAAAALAELAAGDGDLARIAERWLP